MKFANTPCPTRTSFRKFTFGNLKSNVAPLAVTVAATMPVWEFISVIVQHGACARALCANTPAESNTPKISIRNRFITSSGRRFSGIHAAQFRLFATRGGV